MYVKVPAKAKAVSAVKNQPPITFTTPATRYTALSLPHALSANEVPMATMKVTYVVERGSFMLVAIEIKIPATAKLIEARIISNAGRSLAFSSEISIAGVWKLEVILVCTEAG